MMIQGDRRLGIERRLFEYSGYFPERRVDKERRSGNDRRNDTSCENDGLERRCTD
jgi:hypothetical protein